MTGTPAHKPRRLLPMKLLLDALRLELAASRRAERTVATYLTIARAFLAGCARSAPAAPDRTDAVTFLARPRADGGQRSPSTRNQELAALRALADAAVRAGIWPVDPTADLAFLREPARTPTVLDADEVRRLFRALADRTRDPRRRARDLAVLALLSQLGLRVHEVVALDVHQVDLAGATLVQVLGKGGTRHDLPLNRPAVALLRAWLGMRAAAATPALFTSRQSGRLGVRAVQRLLERLRGEMGTSKRVSPHALRHSFATIALTYDAQLVAVSQLMRHASLATTQRYIHLADRSRRDAVQRLGVSVPRELLDGAGDVQVPDEHALFGEPANDVEKPLDVHEELGGGREAA